jgi:cysteine desulfurase
VGTIQPIAELAAIARTKGIMLHTDAVQAAGQLMLDVQSLGVDLMSISAHKYYGPKGVGVLYIRRGGEILPETTGGSHENGRRAGTQNTPLIVGMAKALELAYQERNERVERYKKLREILIDGVLSQVPDSELTGHPENRLPSHASFVFRGIEANQLLMHLDMRGIAASSGSACKTGNPEPSEVLLALGYDRELAMSGLRLTVGKDTTEDDALYAVEAVVESVAALRKLQPTKMMM